jgi:glyoxylase-like metal-dependent hydrolase (beta-lactamase superfamily II)
VGEGAARVGRRERLAAGARAAGPLTMERLHAVVGPLQTNVYVLADPASREAIAIDTAIPCLEWIAGALDERGWTLKLIVSTHGHWDSRRRERGRRRAHRRPDRRPSARRAPPHRSPAAVGPFEIPPSVPAVELAEGGEIRFGEIRLRVLHTPGHTEGSVCLLSADDGLLLSGDTLFPSGWGRVDLQVAPRGRWSNRCAASPSSRRTPAGCCPGTAPADHDRPPRARRGSTSSVAEGRLPLGSVVFRRRYVPSKHRGPQDGRPDERPRCRSPIRGGALQLERRRERGEG